MSRQIDLIVIHCSDSPNGRPDTVQDIDAWHRQRGWLRSATFKTRFNTGLTSIGYHYVIHTDGTVHTGRHPDEIGAHAVGHNSRSLGICLIGTDRFSLPQWDALRNLVNDLTIQHPGARVCGHHDLPGVHKTCPGFDVAHWREIGQVALAGHVVEAA